MFGHSLGSLRHGVFGQFSGEEQTDSDLDLSAGDGASPVVVSQPGGLSGDTLKDVIHEGVHDGHGLAGYTGVRVDLLEDLVDVDGVRFSPPPLPLLVSGTGGLCLAGGLLCSLGCSQASFVPAIIMNIQIFKFEKQMTASVVWTFVFHKFMLLFMVISISDMCETSATKLTGCPPSASSSYFSLIGWFSSTHFKFSLWPMCWKCSVVLLRVVYQILKGNVPKPTTLEWTVV